MSKKKTKIPRFGSDIVKFFTRKAGAIPHKLTKRSKTRNTKQTIEKIKDEY